MVYAHNQRVTFVEAVCEVGSGSNGRRPKFLKHLANPEIQTIVVEHRDRLMRFGHWLDQTHAWCLQAAGSTHRE